MREGEKTILQMAAELQCSKQALQKRMAREPLKTALEGLVYTDGGTKVLSIAAQVAIKEAFGRDYVQMSMDVHTDKSIDRSIDVDRDKFYRDQLEKKDKEIISKNYQLQKNMELLQAQSEQLATKDEQINGLIQLTSQQQELTKQLQDTIEQMKQLPPPPPDPPKKKWWPW